MGRVAFGAVSGALLGALVVILIGALAGVREPLDEPYSTKVGVELQENPTELVKALRAGTRSAVVALIWVVVWTGVGVLLGVMGLDFGVRARMALGAFEGWRVVMGVSAVAAILVILAGSWEIGWLSFAVLAVGFTVCTLGLTALGAIRVRWQ